MRTATVSKPVSVTINTKIALLLFLFQMPETVNVLSYEARLKRVISSMEFILDYDYDTEKELWCKIKLAVSICLIIIMLR